MLYIGILFLSYYESKQLFEIQQRKKTFKCLPQIFLLFEYMQAHLLPKHLFFSSANQRLLNECVCCETDLHRQQTSACNKAHLRPHTQINDPPPLFTQRVLALSGATLSQVKQMPSPRKGWPHGGGGEEKNSRKPEMHGRETDTPLDWNLME